MSNLLFTGTYNHYFQKVCGICASFSPSDSLVLPDEFNAKGYHPPRLKAEMTANECSRSLFCQSSCPEFAIFIKYGTKM